MLFCGEFGLEKFTKVLKFCCDEDVEMLKVELVIDELLVVKKNDDDEDEC